LITNEKVIVIINDH